jgi:hypothetical protein
MGVDASCIVNASMREILFQPMLSEPIRSNKIGRSDWPSGQNGRTGGTKPFLAGSDQFAQHSYETLKGVDFQFFQGKKKFLPISVHYVEF